MLMLFDSGWILKMTPISLRKLQKTEQMPRRHPQWKFLASLEVVKAQKAPLLLYIGGLLIFWLVRVFYWHVTAEVPFSDLADNILLGERVAEHFHFWLTPFWLS